MSAAPLIPRSDAELLARVFRVSLVEVSGDSATSTAITPRGMSSQVPNTPLVFLSDLAAQLAKEVPPDGDPLAKWSELSARKALYDRVLIERLSSQNEPVADFLIASFRRAAESRARRPRDATDEFEELHNYLLELCVSYTAIALQNPTFFPQPAEAEEQGVLRLLAPLKNDGVDSGLPSGFLASLTARMQEEDGLADLALPLMERIAADVRGLERGILDDGLLSCYRATLAIVREKPLAAVIAADGKWLAQSITGAMLERRSMLGALFGVSCFPSDPTVPKLCFQDLTGPSLESDTRTLRMSLQVVQRALKSISTELLKNGDAKEPFFKMVSAACTLNQVRAQQFFPINETNRLVHLLDPQRSEPPQNAPIASSDGFMINLGSVLLQLCEPFMAPNSPHAAKIDATYLLSTHRLQLDKETKLCATADDVMYWLDPRNPDLRQRYLEHMRDEMVEPEPEGTPPLAVSASFGTISEYFFLAMRTLHLGLLSSFTVFNELARHHHMSKNEQDLREGEIARLRQMGGGAPNPLLEQMEAEIAKFREMNAAITRFLHCYQTQLLDPDLLSLALRYYRLVSRWLVAAAEPPPEGLPLSPKVPRLFASLPEFCLDDVAQFLKHLTNFAPHVLEDLPPDELYDFVTLMVTFIGSPKYVKNPYLRATFTRLLRFLVPNSDENADARGRRAHGSDRLAAVFQVHPLAKKHLAPAIMQFFVDIEFTGSHQQAYDKYEFRHEMTQILEYFWTLPDYRAAMVGFTRDTPHFVRFINMLINDSIYSMDEALTKLASIHAMQLEMADEARWASQPRQQLHQRMQTHQQEETHARYFMQFTTEVLHMMKYLSSDKEVAAVFMLPELAYRIASMLNYFLVQLVGAKSKNLKVKNPDKYLFNPAKLLLTVCTIITQFSPLPEFAQAVVKDDRSFDPSNMRKALKVLSQRMSMPLDGLEMLEQFCERCVALKQQEDEEEAELGEVPDEFLCEITMDIMEDPVRLPSGKVVDRKNICRHLLSDETDPYSRKRLTVDMLEPAPDIKAKIEAFRASKKGSRSAAVNMEVG